MSNRLAKLAEFLRTLLARAIAALPRFGTAGLRKSTTAISRLRARIVPVTLLALLGIIVWRHPPIQTVARGEVAVRSNLLTGHVSQFGEGSLWVVPGLHQLRRFSIRDQLYRPKKSTKATGEAPFQSLEGLSLGVDLAVRYAIDPRHLSALAKDMPDDIAGEVIEPAVQGVIYQLFARYTVREIFSSKRSESYS